MNTQKSLEVKELEPALRPRELLESHGVSHLSDRQLLALLIGFGSREKGVAALSEEVLDLLEKSRFSADMEELQKISGLGRAKAGTIIAALEFARRTLWPEKHKIRCPGDIYPLVAHYADRKQEYFLCVSLNGAHEVLAIRIVSIGLVNRTVVHPREVFSEPINERATAVICCHNHPSGNLEPSEEDRTITRRLREAGEILGVPLLDHVIFAREGYYSFLEREGMG